MKDIPEQLRAITRLVTHENAMGDMYRAYAERFPEQADLFTQLAREETAHVLLIQELAEAVKQGVTQVDPRRFPSAAFHTSLQFIQEQTRQAATPHFTLLEALSISHDVEEALIERRFLDVFESDAPELKRLLLRLAKETAAHRSLLREAWEHERQRGR